MTVTTFSELELDESLLEALQDKGFTRPTAIQAAAIPPALDGRDVLGSAPTGTGKTAAYLLPALQHLLDFPRKKSGPPRILILTPTRELAMQVADHARELAKHTHLDIATITGGVAYMNHAEVFSENQDIVVATTGRLLQYIKEENFDCRAVETLILDEADRMLDMGFSDDIMQIVKYLPKERQTIMFSATMPSKIQQLAKTILNNPVEVKLAVSKPAEKIIQTAYICYERQKLGIIQSLFQDQTPERVIIFASSKLKVKEVTQAFKRMKLNVGEMHSDLEQPQREQIMRDFKGGRINILIATDIVSRGIDIDDIRLVINYDVPHDSEDYVHRIGRTARANHDGCAITFVSEKEQTQFKAIENFLGREIYKIPVPEELGEAPEFAPRAGRSFGGNRAGGRGKGNYKGKRSNNNRPDNRRNNPKQ